MSVVSYDGKKIVPAPFLNIVKTYQKSGNGDIIGKVYNITVAGSLVTHMGSPNSSGIFWDQSGHPPSEDIDGDSKLAALFRKQEALRDLFSQEGKNFYAQAADGSQPISCYPRVNSINFSEGIWVERCDYTIELETDTLDGLYDEEAKGHDNFSQYISDAQESWTIDTNEDPLSTNGDTTYSLSHTISAVGKKVYVEGTQTTEAWEYAKNWVLTKLGIDNTRALSPDINNLPDYYHGINHVRSEQVDEQGGSFFVTENWLMASGLAIEDFNIRTANSFDSPHNTVTIDGSVRGFEEKDSNMDVTSTKWNNALEKFHWASGIAYTRAGQFSGLSLNIIPLSTSVAKNPLRGTVDYTFEYDDRPMNFIEGAKREVISINDNIGGELYASVFVLGRSAGPVLQDLGTKPANTRTLNIEVIVPTPTYSDRTTDTIKDVFITQNPGTAGSPYYDDLTTLIDAVDPTNNGATTVFQDQPQESWSPKEGAFSYTTNWTYE